MTLDNFIEQNVSRKKRLFLLIISSIGWALVAAGVMVTSLTINDIVAYWKLSKVFSAVMASSTFFGMIAGAVSSGLISDTFGRKNSCVIFSSIFTLFSFSGGIASTPEMFLAFRIIAGFGMGGLLPALNTYLAEFLNISIRGMYLVLLEASWAVGSIILGVFHLLFKNTLTWRGDYLFFISGLIPLIFIMFMHESPKYLLIKKRYDKIQKLYNTDGSDIILPVNSKKYRVSDLFRDNHMKITLNVWLLWFTMSIGYYGIFVWIKSILISKNISVLSADWYTFYMFVAQLPGYLLAALLIEKVGRRKSLLFFMIGTGVSSLAFAFVSTQSQVLIFSLIVSVFCLGAWGITYAYTPELYPTHIRGIGNGSASAITRFAGFLAPYYTSFFLEHSITVGLVGIAILFVITGILNFLFLPETMNKEVN